jgi:hypothetical protein
MSSQSPKSPKRKILKFSRTRVSLPNSSMSDDLVSRAKKTAWGILSWEAGVLISFGTYFYSLLLLVGLGVILTSVGLKSETLIPLILKGNIPLIIMLVGIIVFMIFLITLISDSFHDFKIRDSSESWIALLTLLTVLIVSLLASVAENQYLRYTEGLFLLRTLSIFSSILGVAYLYEINGGRFLDFLRDRVSFGPGLASVIIMSMTVVASSNYLTQGNLVITRDWLLGSMFVGSVIALFLLRKYPSLAIFVITVIWLIPSYQIQPEKLIATGSIVVDMLITNQCEIKMLDTFGDWWNNRKKFRIVLFYINLLFFGFMWCFYNTDLQSLLVGFGLFFILSVVIPMYLLKFNTFTWCYFLLLEISAAFPLGLSMYSSIESSVTDNVPLFKFASIFIASFFVIIPELLFKRGDISSNDLSRSLWK